MVCPSTSGWTSTRTPSRPGILRADQQIPDVERITHDEPSVRRLVGRLGDPRRLRACYQAGPTGLELARLLHSMSVDCQVIAPSLIPKAPGDKARDRPAGLPAAHRGCTAPASWSPSTSPPSTRRRCGTCAAPGPTGSKTSPGRKTGSASSCCATAALAGRVDPDHAYQAWLRSQRFDQPAMTQTFGHYLAVVEIRNTQLDAVQADLGGWCDRAPLDWQVARLAAYRGITRLGALTWPPRSPTGAGSPPPTRSWALRAGPKPILQRHHRPPGPAHQGAGNTHLRAQLIESAWALKHRPAVGVQIARRQQGLPPAVAARAWAAQQRLCARFRVLARPQERQARRGGRDRPGARRVLVGRDDRLTPPTAPVT